MLFRQSYPALTNGGVVNAAVPCGTGALVTQTTLKTSNSSVSAAGALDGEELLPVELLECGTTPAGALDHEELLHVEGGTFLKSPRNQVAPEPGP